MKPTAVLCVFSLLCGQAGAQESPTFRIGTRLVELQVVVTTKDGKPVKGLTEADFTVLENGKPQTLAFFNTAEDAAPAGEALPPGVFSNRPEYAPANPRSVTVILLDWMNTDQRDQLYAKAEVARYLKEMSPKDRVALYEMAGGIRVAHDFTDDPASLLKRVEKMRANWPAAGLNEDQMLRQLSELVEDLLSLRPDGTRGPVEDARSEVSNFSKEIRVTSTLKQFEFLAQRLAGIPGRKNLVWVSGGVPLLATWSMMAVGSSANPGMRTFAKEFERSVRALTDANVAVYTLDARGLRIETDQPQMATVAANRPGFAGAQAAGMRDAMAGDTLSSIQALPEETGGRVFRNINELSAGIKQAVEDAANSYTLAYYSPEDKNRKPRKLEVKLTRKDVELHVKKSLTVGSVATGLAATELLQSPLAATGILLNAQVVKTGGSDYRATVQIDPATLSLKEDKGEAKGVVELYYAMIQSDGKAKTTSSKVNLSLKPEQVKQLAQNGLVIPKDLSAPSGAALLRIVVRDGETGTSGSVEVPLKNVPSGQ